MTRDQGSESGSEDAGRDAFSIPTVVQVFVLFIVFFIPMATLAGVPAVLGDVVTGDFGPTHPDDVTLNDYNAIEAIHADNGTVSVVLADDPTLAATAPINRDRITHIELGRADGAVQERRNVIDGVRTFEWETSNGSDGEYTVTLVEHVPQDPGISGSPEREDTNTVTFRVVNGNVRDIEVPYSATHTPDMTQRHSPLPTYNIPNH